MALLRYNQLMDERLIFEVYPYILKCLKLCHVKYCKPLSIIMAISCQPLVCIDTFVLRPKKQTAVQREARLRFTIPHGGNKPF